MQKAASAATAAAGGTLKLNPCDRDDSRVGRAIALLTEGTDCRCCIGARIVFALVLGLAIGAAIGKFGL